MVLTHNVLTFLECFYLVSCICTAKMVRIKSMQLLKWFLFVLLRGYLHLSSLDLDLGTFAKRRLVGKSCVTGSMRVASKFDNDMTFKLAALVWFIIMH